MQPTDRELLKACREGDESAWEVLVDRYQRLIYAIPRRAGLDEDQASEVFQEVFATLLQKLDDITEPDRLHAWLVTTARRKTWRLLSKERLLRPANTSDERREEELVDEGLLQHRGEIDPVAEHERLRAVERVHLRR